MTKNRNGKLEKKTPRTLAHAAVDLGLHIQKNQSLYIEWFSIARENIIDDGGALAGNPHKRHIS